MSNKTAKVTAAGRTTTVAVPIGHKPPGRAKLHAKVGVVVVAALVVLTALGVAVRLVVSHVQGKQGNTATTHLTNAQKAAKISDYGQASYATINGDYAAAQLALDNQLPKATTPQQKAVIYSQKMSLAINDKQYHDALTFGQNAENSQKTEMTATLYYQMYLAQGNKPQAKQWLQMAIDRLNKNSDLYDEQLKEFQVDMAGLN